MRLLFESYPYEKADVSAYCSACGESLVGYTKGEKAVFDCVGYFYSSQLKDAVFILPKVLLDENAQAFGKYHPEDLLTLDCIPENQDKAMPDTAERQFIARLAVWLYQAIDCYSIRQWQNQSVDEAPISDILTNRSASDKSSRTYLDIILQLFRFHKEHNRLFTYISLVKAGGSTRINWNRTLARKQPLLWENIPFYHEFETNRKVVNFDEQLVVLFYSVLVFLSERYHFRVVTTLNYTLIPSHRIQNMLDTGKGTRFLRSIRRNYFKDELVSLWKLLYVFFDKSEKIASGRYHSERLIVRKFNNVFEDMIDHLLSDSCEHVPCKLRNQADGKLVDHIYLDNALTSPQEDIYFIGDSKYYQEKVGVGENSIYKQFTYAKNVIQFNVGILDGKEEKDILRYRDELTEGYNITPNFFIRGKLDFNDLKNDNPKLQRPDNLNEQEHIMTQFDDRLFDRDTLLIQCYNINFLYVMNAYISWGGHEAFRKDVRERFRKDILKRLNEQYVFLLATHPDIKQQETFVIQNFKMLTGKMYRMRDDSTSLLFAFARKNVSGGKSASALETCKELLGQAEINYREVTLPLDSAL